MNRVLHPVPLGRLMLAAGLILPFAGCYSSDAYNKAIDERNSANRRLDDFGKINEENSKTIEQLNQEKSQLGRENDSMKASTAAAQRRIEELQAKIDELGKSVIPGVDTFSENGVFTYRIQGALLFDSGKAAVKPSGQKALDEIAGILKGNDFEVEVAGHTDTDPIQATKDKFENNTELGAMRAIAVLNALRKEGVPPDRMHISSYGEYKPVDPADKSKNRRVEIRVLFAEAKPAQG